VGNYYGIIGIIKLGLCTLMNPNDSNARQRLKNANSADISALSKVVARLKELNSAKATLKNILQLSDLVSTDIRQKAKLGRKGRPCPKFDYWPPLNTYSIHILQNMLLCTP